MPIKVSGTEVDAVPGELARLLRRLSRESRGASYHEHCLRSLGIDALDPELDVAVLARDPADPRIEAPASEQPCGDAGCPQRIRHRLNDTQLRIRPLVHPTSLPEADSGENRARLMGPGHAAPGAGRRN